MKLLVIGPKITDLSQVSNFSGVWSYYLRRELLREGVELAFMDRPPHGMETAAFEALDRGVADHVLALGSRYLSRIGSLACAKLDSRVNGLVTQINDGALMAEDFIDCTFTVRDDRARSIGFDDRVNHYVGWAADPRLLKPAHEPGELRILIDHPYYGRSSRDLTETLTRDVLTTDFGKGWGNVRVRRIQDNGFADVDAPEAPPFTRQHVPYAEACAEYAKTHIFIVTHPESVGLTALECAMAGALVVSPAGYIPADRLMTIRHVEIPAWGPIPWTRVLASVQPGASRSIAMVQDWASVAGRMLARFR